MASPASNPKCAKSIQSWIHRLPVEIRMAIALRAATSCLGDHAGPTLTTHANICVLDPGRSGFWLRPKKLQYSIRLNHSGPLYKLLGPFLELCQETRAAALNTQLFALSFEYHKAPKPGPTWHHQFIQTGPELPLFSGAVKEVVVSRLSCAREAKVLFFTLRHFFGTNIRRIYLSQEDYFSRDEEADWVVSPQTGRAYRTGAWGSPLKNVELMLTQFEDQPLVAMKSAMRCEYGEFKEQDAQAFVTRPSRTPEHSTDLLVPFCEVFRQHRDGRLMINYGLKGGLDKRSGTYTIDRFPQAIFKQLVQRGQIYFPDLEYISACVRTSST